MGKRGDQVGRWAARLRINLRHWQWPGDRRWVRSAGSALAAAGVAVALAAGLSLFLTRPGSPPQPRSSAGQPIAQPAPQQPAAPSGSQGSVAAPAPQASLPPAAVTPADGVAAVAAAAGAPPPLTAPLKGAVLQGYGWAYAPSFGDWRFHGGVDLAAASGQPVAAAAAGRVSSVEVDPLWGRTVRIQHAGSLVTVYRGLAETPVKVDQGVAAGQTIGWLGAPAAAESDEPPHLHLEVWQGDKPLDPASVMVLAPSRPG